MSELVVVGAGKVGRAVAITLLQADLACTLQVIDCNPESHLSEELGPRARLRRQDAMDAYAEFRIASRGQIVCCCQPREQSFRLAVRCAENAVPFVTVNRFSEEQLAVLRRLAVRSPVFVGCGLEPGLTEALLLRALSLEPDCSKGEVYCGANPLVPDQRFPYRWSFGGGIPFNRRTALRYSDGKLLGVARFDEPGVVQISGVGAMEAFHDGMASWVTEVIRDHPMLELTQQTLRWPGWLAKYLTLSELGLLSREPLAFGGVSVPRHELTEKLLTAEFGELWDHRDFVIISVRLAGKLRRLCLDVRIEHDDVARLSAANRATSAALTCVVGFLRRGWAAPGVSFLHDLTRNSAACLDDVLAKLGAREVLTQ